MFIFEMDVTAAAPDDECLYPSENSKILHLVRHAQGIHNVAGEKNHDALRSPEFFDAELSPLGWEQVSSLRKHVQESGLSRKIELVITSPLLRAMQTALGVFGSEDLVTKLDASAILKEANPEDGRHEHDQIPSSKWPPIVAVELCRERTGVHPCDKRRTIAEKRSVFPFINFSLIESDEDIMWKADVRETSQEVVARGLKFMDWLWTLEEKEIAVVTHNRFLEYTLDALASDCNPSVKSEICKQFKNCELRSLVVVDKRLVTLLKN